MVNIKTLSKQLNISSRTLRYYEELGLIKSQKINNLRHYFCEEIDKIDLIMLLRKIDLSLSEIKTLLDDYSIDKVNTIIRDKIDTYYMNIANNSKKLYMLIQIEKKLTKANEVKDVILNETAKLLNQDDKRIEIINNFFKALENEEYNQIIQFIDSRMDINILRKVFIDDMKLNDNDYQYSIYSHLSYYNNNIYIKLIKVKTHIIRFVFSDDNIIIGIWLDKIY